MKTHLKIAYWNNYDKIVINISDDERGLYAKFECPFAEKERANSFLQWALPSTKVLARYTICQYTERETYDKFRKWIATLRREFGITIKSNVDMDLIR